MIFLTHRQFLLKVAAIAQRWSERRTDRGTSSGSQWWLDQSFECRRGRECRSGYPEPPHDLCLAFDPKYPTTTYTCLQESGVAMLCAWVCVCVSCSPDSSVRCWTESSVCQGHWKERSNLPCPQRWNTSGSSPPPPSHSWPTNINKLPQTNRWTNRITDDKKIKQTFWKREVRYQELSRIKVKHS